MSIDDRRGRDGLKGRTDASPGTTAAPGTTGVAGAPYGNQNDPADFAYGEPHGPRPPHFDVLPKAEIDAPPAERRAAAVPQPRYEGAERVEGAYASGMTTAETFRTTGDQMPAEVRRDLPEFRREADATRSDDDRSDGSEGAHDGRTDR